MGPHLRIALRSRADDRADGSPGTVAMFDWNDLRHFLAVARHGSTLAGARALGVNQSTVQRRVGELEKRLGQALVTRHATGYRLTPVGESLLPAARQIEEAVHAFMQAAHAAGRDATGIIRVTCPEPLVYRLSKTTLLERFHALHPALQVEFVSSDRYVDLASGEADVALRSGDTEDGELIGCRIGDSLWAVYASRAYVERHGAPGAVAELARHALVGFDEAMSNHRAARWIAAVAPGVRIVARNDSVLGLLNSVRAGLGIAPLPTALGDAEPELVRLFGPVPELTRLWRILVRPEMRHAPRVSAFFDFIVSERDALRPIITG